MLKIQNLEVNFEVQGGSDEDRFANLFEKHIKRWHRTETETQTRECRLAEESALIDRRKEGHHA